MLSAASKTPSIRHSAGPKARPVRPVWRPPCARRCFRAAHASGRASVSRWLRPAAKTTPRSRKRRRLDRAFALRVAGSRRPAVFRRRRHAARPTDRARRLWRTAGGAGRRWLDRSGVPEFARAAHLPHRLGGLLIIIGRTRSARRPASSRARPGNASRGRSRALSSRQDGSLFAASTEARRRVCRREPERWRLLGERLGEAYQVADDIRDAVGNAQELGKPVGRDAALGRPSATQQFGVQGAVERLERLVREGIESIPLCPGAHDLRALIMLEATRLLPKGLARHAAPDPPMTHRRKDACRGADARGAAPVADMCATDFTRSATGCWEALFSSDFRPLFR